jgi:hypothetical protein
MAFFSANLGPSFPMLSPSTISGAAQCDTSFRVLDPGTQGHRHIRTVPCWPNLFLRVRRQMPWDHVLELAKTYNVMRCAAQLYVDSQMVLFRNEIAVV